MKSTLRDFKEYSRLLQRTKIVKKTSLGEKSGIKHFLQKYNDALEDQAECLKHSYAVAGCLKKTNACKNAPK